MRIHRLDGRLRTAAGVLVMMATSGCVVLKRDFDALAERHQTEAAARRAAEQDLAAAKRKLAALQQRVGELEQRLAQNDQVLEKRESELDARVQTLAKAEFDYAVLEREKAEAAELVAQLRGELERLGRHLQAYAADKQTLSAEREALLEQLGEAQARVEQLAAARAQAAERLELVEAMALTLQPQIDAQAASLHSDAEAITVELASDVLFRPRSAKWQPRGEQLLAAVGKLLREGNGPLQLALSGGSDSARLGQQRLERVSRALIGAEVPAERIQIEGRQPKQRSERTSEWLQLRILPSAPPERVAPEGAGQPAAPGSRQAPGSPNAPRSQGAGAPADARAPTSGSVAPGTPPASSRSAAHDAAAAARR